MRAYEIALELLAYQGATDTELFEMAEGTTDADITDNIRQHAEERYREWVESRDKAMAVLQLLRDETIDSGAMMSDAVWNEVVAEFGEKYNNHKRACLTRLPLSLQRFESEIGHKRHRNTLTQEGYRQILLSGDPVQALAKTFKVSEEEVEKTRQPPQEYLEWTFLARVISKYAKARNANACIGLTRHLIRTLVNGTYSSSFSKTKINGNGSSSYEFSMFSMDIDELEGMALYLQSKGAEPRIIVLSLERIWHLAIPKVHREWLGIDIDPRESVVRLLTPPSAPPSAPPPPPTPPPQPPPKRQRIPVGMLNTMKPKR